MTTIHEAIKQAREAKGWSMQQLADAVSKAERLAKPLAWQTVQQWENGSSAPRRLRMATVAKVLGFEPQAAAYDPNTPHAKDLEYALRVVTHEIASTDPLTRASVVPLFTLIGTANTDVVDISQRMFTLLNKDSGEKKPSSPRQPWLGADLPTGGMKPHGQGHRVQAQRKSK